MDAHLYPPLSVCCPDSYFARDRRHLHEPAQQHRHEAPDRRRHRFSIQQHRGGRALHGGHARRKRGALGDRRTDSGCDQHPRAKRHSGRDLRPHAAHGLAVAGAVSQRRPPAALKRRCRHGCERRHELSAEFRHGRRAVCRLACDHSVLRSCHGAHRPRRRAAERDLLACARAQDARLQQAHEGAHQRGHELP